MIRIVFVWMMVCGCVAGAIVAPARGQSHEAITKDVLLTLNGKDQVKGTDDIKSYKILFDAYLKLTKPPMAVGPEFNLNTIHPKMSNWMAVNGWAESNAPMAQAIVQCKDKVILGLPYGRDGIDPAYVKAGLIADIAV